MRKLWGKPAIRWAAVVGWMALIFFLSGQSDLPDLTGGRFPDVQGILGHFTVYLVLAWLWGRALAGAGLPHPGGWAFVLTLLYALSDEFHQRFVPARLPSFFDLATDAVGAAVGLGLRRLVHRTWTAAAEAPRAAAD